MSDEKREAPRPPKVGEPGYGVDGPNVVPAAEEPQRGPDWRKWMDPKRRLGPPQKLGEGRK